MKFSISSSRSSSTPSPPSNKQQPQQRNKSFVPSSPPSPTAIAGYAISNCIGRGSFSTVYKAHRNRGRYEVVAIKCIQISSLSKRSKENLIEEINILRRINHENVVSMKKFTWDATNIYLILDYCPGGNLAEFIRTKGRLSEFLVRHFAQQLVQGLAVLHSENIVHSDLKPANILLSLPPVGSCRNVRLKIADFGFSRRLDSNDSYTMGIKGSPLYMAPEVLNSQPYSGKADLYSLGIILYECLFGAAPYKTMDLGLLTKRILSKDPIRVPKNADISDDCCDLLERLLVKDQTKRMDFEELYRHQFIDIAHCPTMENYCKGVCMVKQATLLDNNRNYEDARAFYVEGLRFLVPAYHWLGSFSDNQRKYLSGRIKDYFSRAEHIGGTMQLPAVKAN